MSALEVSFVLKKANDADHNISNTNNTNNINNKSRRESEIARNSLLGGPYLYVEHTRELLRVAFKNALTKQEWRKLKACIKKACGGKKSNNTFKLKPRKRVFHFEGR